MKILVLANFGMGLYNFRKELLKELIKQNHDIYISLPFDEYVNKLEDIGCKFIDTSLERRGTNPLKDIKLLFSYVGMIKRIKPDVVLTYTIKPNVYGGLACSITKTPYITNITGLGNAVENRGLIQKITLLLYSIGIKNASCVFFQNQANRMFFENKQILKNKARLIPGSGVNLDEHKFEKYPEKGDTIQFNFIGRIMKSKGIEELLEAAQLVKKDYPKAEFHLVGGAEDDYSEKIEEMEKLGVIRYYGQRNDVHSFIKNSHATILPSYHEGLANVLLESASSGRPVLASRVSGCIETFEHNITGIGFEVRDVESLVQAIIHFINLPYSEKRKMGFAGRKKMENEFDRNIIIAAYLEEINNILAKGNNNESVREIS